MKSDIINMANAMDINSDLYSSPDDDYIEDVAAISAKEEVICELLIERGIRIKLVRCKLNGVPVYYGVWLIVNPRRLLGDNDYVGVFDIRMVDKLLDSFYWTLFGIGISYLMSGFKLNRIDMCRNIFLYNQGTVKTYLELMKKCYVPTGYTWNEVGGVEFGIQLKDGIRIASNSLAVVAYNKQAQMIKQNGYYSPVAIEEAAGLLRFEIQLYARRLRYLCRLDNSLNNLRNFIHCSEALSVQHFEEYIPKVFLRGDYYPIEVSRKIVADSDFYVSTKQKMLTLLNRVSTQRNLMTALDDVCRQYNPTDPYQFTRNLIKCFDAIYLNPVTIPRRWEAAAEMFLPGAYNQVMGVETLFFNLES
jgi:hypothetical protein